MSSTSISIPTTGLTMFANSTAASASLAPHPLQRHLGAELRYADNLKERVALTDSEVLGERAEDLPHEPHRRILDRLATRGPDETRDGHHGSVALARSSAPARLDVGRQSAPTRQHDRFPFHRTCHGRWKRLVRCDIVDADERSRCLVPRPGESPETTTVERSV